MRKEIYLAVSNRLREACPSLRWIDYDEGQLSALSRPPIAYPACLIEMSYPECREASGHMQNVRVEFRFSLVFDRTGSLSEHAPKEVQEYACRVFDIIREVHQALQWWDAGKLFMPMHRTRVIPVKRSDAHKVYELYYQLNYMDAP